MATSFNKTYTIVVKYSYDDGATITDSDLNAGILRSEIIKKVGAVVPRSKGILSAHIVGSVSEA